MRAGQAQVTSAVRGKRVTSLLALAALIVTGGAPAHAHPDHPDGVDESDDRFHELYPDVAHDDAAGITHIGVAGLGVNWPFNLVEANVGWSWRWPGVLSLRGQAGLGVQLGDGGGFTFELYAGYPFDWNGTRSRTYDVGRDEEREVVMPSHDAVIAELGVISGPLAVTDLEPRVGAYFVHDQVGRTWSIAIGARYLYHYDARIAVRGESGGERLVEDRADNVGEIALHLLVDPVQPYDDERYETDALKPAPVGGMLLWSGPLWGGMPFAIEAGIGYLPAGAIYGKLGAKLYFQLF